MTRKQLSRILGTCVSVLIIAGIVGYFTIIRPRLGINPEQLVSCDMMPTVDEVKEAIADHPDIVRKLKSEVSLDLSVEPVRIANCSSGRIQKAEIRVFVATEIQREKASIILKDEPFGVPAAAINI